MSVLTRETLPKEGVMTPEIALLLKKGDMVYFDPVPNLRISRPIGHRGSNPPRKYYPRTGWYSLLRDPYLECPEDKAYQFKIQNLASDNILGAVFGDHWFYKYRLDNTEIKPK